MNLKDIAPTSYTKAFEDHSGCEYNIDDGGELSVYMSGYYTLDELHFKTRALVEAAKLHADTQIELSF